MHEVAIQVLATVSERQGLDPLASRLTELRTWLASDMAEVELALRCDAAGDIDGGGLAQRAAAYLLGRPGKRIRPLCVILAARLGGRQTDSVVRDLAAASELVHAATLLHDDVIDQGEVRRGAPSARVIYGNSASVLAGDHLLVEALRRVRRADHPELLDGMLDVIAVMVEAEARQLEARGRFEPSRLAYLTVVEGKTAALFRWGLRAGGVAAGLRAEDLNALDEVGRHFGVAFQLVDDVLDLEGEAAMTGKTTLTDLREGKLTWPLILACEVDHTLLADLRQTLAVGGDLPNLLARVEATGALRATRDEADSRAERASAALTSLPQSPAGDAIGAVVRAAVRRTR
jgi:octaprenyl-diphosphate synthase